MPSPKHLFFLIEAVDGYFYCTPATDLLSVDVNLVEVEQDVKFVYGTMEQTGKVLMKSEKEKDVLSKIKSIRKERKAAKKRESSFHADKPRKAAIKQRKLMSSVIPGSSTNAGPCSTAGGEKSTSSDKAKKERKSKKKNKKKNDLKEKKSVAELKIEQDLAKGLMHDKVETAADENEEAESDSTEKLDLSNVSSSSIESSTEDGRQQKFKKGHFLALREIDDNHKSFYIDPPSPVAIVKSVLESAAGRPALVTSALPPVPKLVVDRNPPPSASPPAATPPAATPPAATPPAATPPAATPPAATPPAASQPGPGPNASDDSTSKQASEDTLYSQETLPLDHPIATEKTIPLDDPLARQVTVPLDNESVEMGKKKRKKSKKKKMKKSKRKSSTSSSEESDDRTKRRRMRKESSSSDSTSSSSEDSSSSEEERPRKKKVARNLDIYPGNNYVCQPTDPDAVLLHADHEVYVKKAHLTEALAAKSPTQFIRLIVDKVYTIEALENATPQGFPARSKGARKLRKTQTKCRLHPAGREAILARATSLEDERKSWRPRVGETKLRQAFSGRCASFRN